MVKLYLPLTAKPVKGNPVTVGNKDYFTMENNDWLGQEEPRRKDKNIMYVDVKGYEGPLDLLLELARKQKVDLSNISVLELAEQYLEFIERVRKSRIDIAADYLVVAAWLAYLKSRLMLPKTNFDDEPSGEMMAAMLQFRLKRLEAMRDASEKLINRPRLNRQIFARGESEQINITQKQIFDVKLYDLLKAYALQRERNIVVNYAPKSRNVWSLQEAREILQRLIGDSMDWVALDKYLVEYLAKKEDRTTILASSFSASLELAREGHLDIKQAKPFAQILLRRRKTDIRD